MVDLSQRAPGSVRLPRDKAGGRRRRRKTTELGIARHGEQRAEKLAVGSGWEWGES